MSIRIAWFGPAATLARNPASSTLAAYTSELLVPYLAKKFSIEIFHNDLRVSPGQILHGVAHWHYLRAYLRNKECPFDLFVHVVADSSQLNFTRHQLGCFPGVVWFHDFLSTCRPPDALAYSGWQLLAKNFTQASEVATAPWPDGEVYPPDNFPFGIRELLSSRCALFANQWALGEAKRRGGGFGQVPPSYWMPIPISSERLLPRSSSGTGGRSAKGVSNGRRRDNIVVFDSPPTIGGRAHQVLEVAAKLGGKFTFRWFVGPHEVEKACELRAQFSLTNCEIIGDRRVSRWIEALRDADVALHLRRSLYGCLQPYLGYSVAMGVPVIVSQHAFADFLPDAVVCKVPLGAGETWALQEAICELSRVALDVEIKQYAIDEWGVERVAREWESVVELHGDEWRDADKRWSAIQTSARQWLLSRWQERTHQAYDIFEVEDRKNIAAGG